MSKSQDKKNEGYADLPRDIADKTSTDIFNERMSTISKSNSLIRKFKTDVSKMQFQLINYLISKAYLMNDSLEFEFDIKHYCDICGLEYDSGTNYKRVKEDLLSLASKAVWAKVYDDPDKETIVRFIDKATVSQRSGKIQITLDKDIKPYITELYERYKATGETYTQFALLYTLPMKSMYSIRLYELLKSWESNNEEHDGRYWEIDELQKLLGSDYKRYQDFRRKVIEKAVEEINQFSDIYISWTPVKKGNRFEKIHFDIYTRTDNEQISIRGKNNKILDDVPIV